MIIFRNYLKRIFKKPANLIFMIVIPFISIVMAMYLSGNGGTAVIGVADYDNTEFTKSLISKLGERCKVVVLEEDQIKQKLTNLLVDYALVIDSGFTDSMIKGGSPVIKGYGIKETDVEVPAKLSIESYVNSARNIAAAAGGDSAKFYKALDAYKSSSFKASTQLFDDSTKKRNEQINAGLSLMVMSMLFLSSFCPVLILEDKRKKTFYRVFAAPVTNKSFMFQSGLSFLAVALIQVILALTATALVFGLKPDMTLLKLFAVFAVFSVTSVSLGIAISGISKDERQASTLASLLLTPICMLGGCFWPRDFMPGFLKLVGEFVPTTWIVRASAKVLNGSTLSGVSKEMGILLLFSLVFFLLGSWKKVDIAA